MVSAFLSLTILFASLFATGEFVIDLLAEYRGIRIALHVVGTLIGLGGALVADSMFFHYLSDRKISRQENQSLD